MFVVSCAGALPELDHVIQTEGGGALELEVRKPEPDVDRLPDHGIWQYIGLTDDLARRVTEARHEVQLVVTDAGASPAQTVLEATKRASELAATADGCVNDFFAMRFFGPDGWRVEEPLADLDMREHTTMHTVPVEDSGATFWVHTHGLVKFGRPEFEIFDVPPGMVDGAAIALVDMGQYVLSGALVSPGETLGDPEVPLHTRLGQRERALGGHSRPRARGRARSVRRRAWFARLVARALRGRIRLTARRSDVPRASRLAPRRRWLRGARAARAS